MKTSKSAVILLVCSLSFASLASAQSTPRLNLRQAVERALSQSPEGETAIRTERNTRLLEKNTWSQLLPSFDFQAQHQYSNRSGTIYNADAHVPWSNLLNLSVTENLYDNGDTWRLAEANTYAREIGGLTLKRTRQTIALKVARAFYDYSSSVALLELEKEQIESIRRQFRTIEGRYRQGVSSSRDYLRIKAQLQQSEIGLITGRSSLEDSLATLREAIGEMNQAEFQPITLKPGELDSAVIPSVTPANTLDFRIAGLQDKISELTYRTVQRADWPRLSLKGSYSYNLPQYIGGRIAGVDDPYWDARAQLVLDYNLWDWGIRRRNVEIADNTRGIEQARQNTTRISTSQALARLTTQAALLQQSYRESRAILKSNEDVYESVNRDYRDGKVTYLDLITALNDLYSSRTQVLNLQFGLLKAQADLASYQGNLDEILLRP